MLILGLNELCTTLYKILRAHSIRSWQKIRALYPPINTQHASLAHQSIIGWKHPITPNSYTQSAETHLYSPSPPTQPNPPHHRCHYNQSPHQWADRRSRSRPGSMVSDARTEGLARRPPPDPGDGHAAAPWIEGGRTATLQWSGVAAQGLGCPSGQP